MRGHQCGPFDPWPLSRGEFANARELLDAAFPGGHQVNPGGHRDADFSWHLDGDREDKPPSQEAAVLLVAAWVRREKPADRGVRLAFLVAA